MTFMSLAEQIARQYHEGQTCKSGGNYIKHPERVAYLVSEKAKNVAWLHDTLEDTTLTGINLMQMGISEEDVISIHILTRIPVESYTEYIHRIAKSGDQVAIEVKLADLRDNLRLGCPSSLVERYLSAIRTLLKVVDSNKIGVQNV